ncbi:MAG TPA: hypothetical protein VHY80_04900 [Stellaceae bacterium]|jgi:hypothetical protein|nr:hypothetical protein [Stellaceae bacterium]
MSAEREVIFEFLRIGAAMKVTAVDATTGTEVSMVADPNAGPATLRRLAKRKLDYVMNRKSA